MVFVKSVRRKVEIKSPCSFTALQGLFPLVLALVWYNDFGLLHCIICHFVWVAAWLENNETLLNLGPMCMKPGGVRERVVLDFVDPNPYNICGSEDVCYYAGFRDLFLLGLALVISIFFSAKTLSVAFHLS